jgi:chaperonin GroES
MNLEPLGDRIIVRADIPEERTAGGLIIPDVAKEKPQTGIVLAIGSGDRCDELPLAVGYRVVYAKFGGVEIEADDGPVLVLSVKDIIAIVHPPAPKLDQPELEYAAAPV